MNKIEVIPYDPNWPEMFEVEKNIVLQALSKNCEAIYHVGSTSVPGLLAKPKIDIIAVAKDRKRAIFDLEKVGYLYKGEWNIPLKCGFTKRGLRKVNLHVFFDKNHPEIDLNLKFRDYLRNNPDVRAEYAAIKMEILRDESSQQKIGKISMPIYTIRKRKFIDGIIQKIGFNRLRVLKSTTDDEWNAAKNFRQKYFFDNQEIQDPYTWTFNHKDYEHFILYRGVEIIGYAHIQLLSKSRAALRIIVLNEENRNLGYGSQFLSIIEEWLKVHEYESLHIESSEEALNFYKKHRYAKMQFNDPDGYLMDPEGIAIGKIL